MDSLKNNKLDKASNVKLCKIHNDKMLRKKAGLSFAKSYICAKTYHPLKRKNVRMNKIRFVEPKASRIKNKSTPTPLLLKKLAYRRFRRLHPAPSGRKKLKS